MPQRAKAGAKAAYSCAGRLRNEAGARRHDNDLAPALLRRVTPKCVHVDQKCAGDKSMGLSVVMRERKQAAWQNQSCHFFLAVSTVRLQGSVSVSAIC